MGWLPGSGGSEPIVAGLCALFLCPAFAPASRPPGRKNDLSVRELNEIIEPLVESLGYEFVGLEYNPNPKHAVLRVYIDCERGITIEDCENVSRETAALLDVRDPIKGHYNLEISSPGLDRPLFTPEHFSQFSGSEVKISLYAPQDGRRKLKGRIRGLHGDAVSIEQDGEEVRLAFDNIAKARLVPDYEKILAAKR